MADAARVDQLRSSVLLRVGIDVPADVLRSWATSPNLMDDLAEGKAFERLRFDLGEGGSVVTDEQASAIGAVVVAVAAAGDPALAKRLTDAHVRIVLEELSVGLGYVLEELLLEILHVRRALEPGSSRSALLEARLIESEELVRRSWLDVGVSEEIAAELSSDPSIGFDVQPVQGELLVATAIAGSGKTLCALRSHQVAIVNAVLDETAPLPARFHARDLLTVPTSETIDASVRPLGDPLVHGVAVVVDGLDEVPASDARVLLSELAAVVRARPVSTVLVLSRPDLPHEGHRTLPLPLPSPRDLEAIAGRIVGRPRPFWGLPESLRRATELPLYAVATAVLMRRGEEVPQSRSQLLAALIELCVKESDLQDVELLPELAHAALSRPVVTDAAFGLARAERAARCRLVRRERGTIGFAIAVYQDWFAAQWILAHGLPVAVRNADPSAVSRWRHALALAVTLAPPAQGDLLLQELSGVSAAPLPLVIEDATVSALAAPTESIRDGSEEARVRTVVESLGKSLLGPLSALPGQAADRAEVHFDGRWLSYEVLNTDGVALQGGGTVVNVHDAAWPWRVALGPLTRQLRNIIDRRAFPLQHEIFARETVWAIARALMNTRSFTHDPIDSVQVRDLLREISARDPSLPTVIHYRRHQLWIPAETLAEAQRHIEEAAADGSPLTRPWITPDNLAGASGWIDDVYTPTTALRLMTAVQEAALEIYQEIVETWFPDWAGFLSTYATLPAVVRYSFRPRVDPSFAAWDGRSWHPLPEGSASTVETVDPSIHEIDWEAGHVASLAEWRAAGREVPPYSRAFSMSRGAVRGMHSGRPATHLAFRWLIDDLSHLGWGSAMGLDDPD